MDQQEDTSFEKAFDLSKEFEKLQKSEMSQGI